MVWFGLVCETVQAGQRLGHAYPILDKARAVFLLLPIHVPHRESERPLPHASSPHTSTSSCQGHPKNLRAQLPAPAEPQSQAKCAMRQRAVLPHKPREKFYTRTHEHFMPPAEPKTAEHARHAKPSCAYPTSHATAVPKLRPRIRFFLLCERPWSSASRCPQGSMVLCAWPDTQQNTNHHRHMASPCKATSQAKLQAMQPPPPPSAAAAAEAALTLPPAMPPCARAKAKPKDPILPALRTAMELSFQMPAGIDGAVRMAGHSAEYQSSPSHGQPLQSHQPGQAASQAAATAAKASAAAAEAAGAAAIHCRQSMPTQPASWR